MSDPQRVIIGRVVRAAFAERARRFSATWTVYILRRRGRLQWSDSRGIVQTAHEADGALELEAPSKGAAERLGLAAAW